MRRSIHESPLALVFAGLLVIVTACGETLDEAAGEGAEAVSQNATQQEEIAAADEEGRDEKDGWPESIVYGVLPTDDTESLLAIYTPFEEYMTECLDHPFELFTGTDYTAMIEAMRTGNLHVSKFGPFSYILAHERAGAEALVQPVDESGVPTYQSLIITLESHGFDSLEDLQGEAFAFVDPTSTSGHLFPRAMMVEELGISNDEIEGWLGETVFSGGHDASVISVLNQDVAAAAISSNTWASQVEGGNYDDHDRRDDLIVLTETRDIPRTTEAIQADLPDDLKQATKSCFEDAIDDPDLESFFSEETNIGGGYIAVDDSAFDVVRDTAGTLEMSPEDLLEE